MLLKDATDSQVKPQRDRGEEEEGVLRRDEGHEGKKDLRISLNQKTRFSAIIISNVLRNE